MTHDIELAKKMCHKCLKWQLLKYYRTSLIAGFDVVHSDYCDKCEGKNGKHITKHDSMRTPNIRIPHKSTVYYAGWIGNTPFKRLCEIFKIRYEK